MIGFTKIVGGSASSVAALGDHLRNQTLPKTEADVAAYYHRGMDSGMREAPAEFAPVLQQDMHPRVAAGLGIDVTRPLTPDEINGLIAGRTAQGEFIAGKKYAKVRSRGKDPKTGEDLTSTPIGSYDFCPSPDKSVSVAWALASPAQRALIYEAHISSAREAVAYIAQKIGVAHAETAGNVEFIPGDVGWMEFTHFTARRTQVTTTDEGVTTVTQDKWEPGDPDMHTHFLIPNAVFCPDGRVGSLHTGMIEGFIFEADGFYQGRMAQKLSDAGFEVELDADKGSARMSAISYALTKLFSKRSNKAEDLARSQAASKGVDWDTLPAKQQTLWTRKAAEGLEGAEKGGKDDVADVAAWKAQAAQLGWEPKSFLSDKVRPELSDEQRQRLGYENSLQFLERKFEHTSVVKHWSLREAAARGSITGGFQGVGDIDAITKIMRDEGIRQYGEMTALTYGHEEGKRYVSVTTQLHEDQEREFIKLAQKVSADKSYSVPRELLDKHIALSGLTFEGVHGKAQKNMIYRSGDAGRFHLGIAAAGAGKTTAWEPLIAGKKEMGGRVFGASLAWEQADDLVKAGIDRQNVKAYSVLIDEIASLKLGPNDLVAVDEWALLGTRQGLQLLRLADHYGFGVTSLGDPKQCNSVEAGNIVNLVKRAVPDQVFEIETTRRQETDREKEFVKRLRNGDAKLALDMKREDGLAEMVPGDSAKLVARTADLYMEWLKETGVAPSVAAPTNYDSHTISLAIRAKRQDVGLVEPDVKIVRAGDNRGQHYGLALAPGDRVRLFKSTGARFTNGKYGNIGRNRTSLDVLSVTQDGISARNVRTGSAGFVAWENLLATRGPSVGRFLLDYAYCKTINSAQGSDSDDHILAMPKGSQAITGLSGYSGSTRHKKRLAILTSDFAERLEIVKRRPLNDPRIIDLDAKWANVARNFSYQPEKDLAVAMLDRVENLRRGTVGRFQKVVQSIEDTIQRVAGPVEVAAHQRQAKSQEPTTDKHVTNIVSEIIVPPETDWRASLPHEEIPKQIDIQAAFAETLEREGFRLKGAPIMDGQWHRVAVDGDKGAQKSGSYRGWDTGGIYNKFRGGTPITFRPDGAVSALSQEQREAQQAADRAQRLQVQAERTAREAKVAGDAQAAWDAAQPANQKHPYLVKKSIQPHGARQGVSGQSVEMKDGRKMSVSGKLLVPLTDEHGKVWNIQVISDDGTKMFLPGRKKGLYATIGPINDGPVVIAEGLATAATIYESTGISAIAAIDGGNLLTVAESIRAQYPDKAIILAADNDHHLPPRGLPNVGIEKATIAADRVGGVVIAPKFAADDKGTDFNDAPKQIPAAFEEKGLAELLRDAAWTKLEPIPSAAPHLRQVQGQQQTPTQGL